MITMIPKSDFKGYHKEDDHGFFKEITDESLPPIIHFENKIMRARDYRDLALETGSSRMGSVTELLTARGYVLIRQGEDSLAIRLE